MERMKDDMAGAAATLGAMRAVAELSLPIRVIGLCGRYREPSWRECAQAGRCGALTGRTVDRDHQHRRRGTPGAGGCAGLCERGMSHRRWSTWRHFTGGCVVALGNVAAGLMGSDQALVDSLRQSGDQTGELGLATAAV